MRPNIHTRLTLHSRQTPHHRAHHTTALTRTLTYSTPSTNIQVDVDSNGRRCKERMLEVLDRIATPTHSTQHLYADFQVKKKVQGVRYAEFRLYDSVSFFS